MASVLRLVFVAFLGLSCLKFTSALPSSGVRPDESASQAESAYPNMYSCEIERLIDLRTRIAQGVSHCAEKERKVCSAARDPVLCSSVIESTSVAVLPPEAGFNETLCKRITLTSVADESSLCFRELWLPLASAPGENEKVIPKVWHLHDGRVRSEHAHYADAVFDGRWMMVNKSFLDNGAEERAVRQMSHGKRTMEVVVCSSVAVDLTRRAFQITGSSYENGVNGRRMASDDLLPLVKARPEHRLRRSSNEILFNEGQSDNKTRSTNVLPNSFRFLERQQKTRVVRPPCKLHRLTADVRRDLGFKDALHPRTVNLYYCKGHCSRRIRRGRADSYVNYHSKLKAIIRKANPTVKLGGSCCMATETSSLLVIVKHGQFVTLVNAPNVIAEKCGCS